MEECKKCKRYRKEYDDFYAMFDDELIVNKPKKRKHYCPMYKNGMPDEIVDDKEKCEFFERRIEQG